MTSARISRVSAMFLALCGLGLLFASDEILPRLIPAFPATGAWLGQILASAWLAVAALDWLSQSALLGGIYGRPVVAANATLYFVSATVFLRVVARRDTPVSLWILFVVIVIFAAVYAWLLFRGPLERDFPRSQRPGL